LSRPLPHCGPHTDHSSCNMNISIIFTIIDIAGTRIQKMVVANPAARCNLYGIDDVPLVRFKQFKKLICYNALMF